MNRVLNELYEALKPDLMSPEERKVLQKESEVIERIEKQLSREDFEAIWDALSHLSEVQAGESFVRGFRLGARLMMEIAE